MAELADLIARVEAAECGSFALDTAIFCAVTGRKEIAEIPGYTITEPNDGTVLKAPPYTTNLQDALALVPEGRARRMVYAPAGHWPYRVWIYPDQTVPLQDEGGPPSLGKTEALAMCLASLRAREGR